MVVILALVCEWTYYCSSPTCTAECTKSHIKIQKCSGVINPDLRPIQPTGAKRGPKVYGRDTAWLTLMYGPWSK